MIDDYELEETTATTQYPAVESHNAVRPVLTIVIDRKEAETKRAKSTKMKAISLHITPITSRIDTVFHRG